jgi:hypothetical protein
MATKSQLITRVNGHLTEVFDIAYHRASMLDLINQLYPAPVTDTQITETYTTKGNSFLTYNIRMVKQGNIVHFLLRVTNNSTVSIPSGEVVFTWKNTEYKPNTISSFNFSSSSIIDDANFFLRESNIIVNSPLAPETIYNTQFITYLTQD